MRIAVLSSAFMEREAVTAEADVFEAMIHVIV